MKYLGGLLQHWRIGVAAILLIGIVHLTVTLLLAYIYQRGGYWRHVRTLPLNTFVILPQARPRAQHRPVGRHRAHEGDVAARLVAASRP